jgi:DNA-binding beta-propeller fold protein YncE
MLRIFLRACETHTRVTVFISIALLFALGVTACASPEQVSQLEQQLAAAETRIDELTQELANLQDEHEHEHVHAAPADDASGAAVQAEGVVYAFAPGKVALIEPSTGRVIHEITEGLEGVDWADALVSPDQRRIFANDRAGAQVLVIDTDTQEIIAHIDVGPRPVHMYNPNRGSEMWTHSDEEGAFYVIDIETLNVPARVVAAAQDTGHGKLLYDETLGNKAYATNTNDPAVYVINLASREVTGVVDLCEGEGGTHAKAFTAGNDFAYFECSALGQVAVVDTSTDTLTGYLDGAGQLFSAPDGSLAVIMDKANGLVRVIDGVNEPSIIAEIPVEGGADQLAFYADGDTLLGFTANTQSPDAAIIDFNEMAVLKRVAAGDIARPEGALFLHRSGIMGGGYFITPASGDGVVAIVNAESQTLQAAVPIAPGVSSVAYVGASE